MKRLLSKAKGFTLAELLIALAILGVIATFTIPKVLTSSSDSQNKAIAKEVAGMISGAYTTYTLQNSFATNTTIGVITDSMNYVKASVLPADNAIGTGGANSIVCAATLTCLYLHSGAIVGIKTAQTFGATDGYIIISVDPDGTRSAMTNGTFALYYNGRLTTGTNATTGTAATGNQTVVADSTATFMQF